MIKISADSTADLNSMFLERNIISLPITVVLGVETYKDGLDIQPEDLYKYVEETGKMPKTSTVSIDEYAEFFKVMTSDGSSLIHISLSSGVSSTYEHAKIAAEGMSNVFVIDSMSLSTGSGLLALYAADLRDEGKLSAKEIAAKVEARVPAVQASFVVDTMEYLHKGGRCSGLTAFVGKALKIKPSLILRDGKISVGAKYMGTVEKNIGKYCNNIVAQFDHPDKTRVFITYTKGTKEAVVEAAKKAVREVLNPDELLETIAGSVITAHCGAGTIGILYINDGE